MESSQQEQSASGSSRQAASLPPCEALTQGLDPGHLQAANDTLMSQLARTIEQEIIPRLMMAHRITPESPVTCASAAQPICQADIEHFAKLVLSPDEDMSFASIQTYRSRGVAIETLYLDLLAPTARYLGVLWEEDLCSFTDVTIGLGRLQRVLRELSPAFGRTPRPASSEARRILLVPSPGEQHTFGLVMVAEFFRRAGWDVTGGAWVMARDIAAMVSAEWFDVVGFSLGAEVHLKALAECIAAVRHATCNRGLAVIVGGPMFGAHPEYVDLIGADGMTIDGSEAPALAEGLILKNALQQGDSGT